MYNVLSLGHGLFFAYDYSIDPITFIEKGVSQPSQLLFTLIKNQLDVFMLFLSSLLWSTDTYLCLCQHYTILITVTIILVVTSLTLFFKD